MTGKRHPGDFRLLVGVFPPTVPWIAEVNRQRIGILFPLVCRVMVPTILSTWETKLSTSVVVRIEERNQGIGLDGWHSICCKTCMNWNDFYAVLASVMFISRFFIPSKDLSTGVSPGDADE
jgi:hypothetical protein